MTNLLGVQYEDAMLHHDLSYQACYIRMPTAHLYHCTARSVQGQRYTIFNEGVFKRDLERLGLKVGGVWQSGRRPCQEHCSAALHSGLALHDQAQGVHVRC